MTDDAVHSTQYYVKYILLNKAILANVQHSQTIETLWANRNTPMAIKILFSWQLASFAVPTHLISIIMLVMFSSKNTIIKMRPQTQAHISICLLDRTYEVSLANIKMEHQRWPENPVILGSSETQYVAMVTKLLSLYCETHLVQSYCKESNFSDTNWLR